jgi:citrate lyase subunit beta/citryl-CoA lyase
MPRFHPSPRSPQDRPERTMLYVPAVSWKMIGKAANSAADAVCIDLEDATPPNDKPAARANVIRAFKELDFGRRIAMFRINALDTPWAYRDLIEVVEAAGDKIENVMLPKATSPDDIVFVDKLLTQIEQWRGFRRQIGIEALIETPGGFLNVREIAQCSTRLESLSWGPGDFAASMRMPLADIGEFDANDALYPGHRWHAAMQSLVAATRIAGIRALDGPYAGYQDTEGFDHAAKIARALGFDGKHCIHPGQLTHCNSIFTPSREEAGKAQRLIDAYEKACAEGLGAISYEGKMIDAVSIRMAQVTIDKFKLAEEAAA